MLCIAVWDAIAIRSSGVALVKSVFWFASGMAHAINVPRLYRISWNVELVELSQSTWNISRSVRVAYSSRYTGL